VQAAGKLAAAGYDEVLQRATLLPESVYLLLQASDVGLVYGGRGRGFCSGGRQLGTHFEHVLLKQAERLGDLFLAGMACQAGAQAQIAVQLIKIALGVHPGIAFPQPSAAGPAGVTFVTRSRVYLHHHLRLHRFV
jgi:hypothetical protein